MGPRIPNMSATLSKDPKQAIGRSPDRLSLDERFALTGKYVAFEIYTPGALPVRRIEAIGDSMEECVARLVARGLDPLLTQSTRLPGPHPYASVARRDRL